MLHVCKIKDEKISRNQGKAEDLVKYDVCETQAVTFLIDVLVV